MKHYTHADKRQQLQQFADSLREAISAIESSGESKISDAPLKASLAHAEQLLAEGFDSDSLKELATGFTPVIWLHKEWTPPLVASSDGTWREPDWFQRLSRAHTRAQQLALELRAYGEY
jgi:hypothetical protein